jgi:PQQ enzyme repeat
VYVGSYDGNLYAFNAQSGAIRWRHPSGGRISGSSTVIGKVVYYSDLGDRRTAGLNVDTGQQVFSFPDGAFTPVIADDQAIYLDGYNRVYQLLPGARPARKRPHRVGAAQRRRRARRLAARAARHRAHNKAANRRKRKSARGRK